MCIGSVIAPVLSDLVLARHSRALDASLKDSAALKVLYKASEKEQASDVDDIMTLFAQKLSDFVLTKDVPTDDEL